MVGDLLRLVVVDLIWVSNVLKGMFCLNTELWNTMYCVICKRIKDEISTFVAGKYRDQVFYLSYMTMVLFCRNTNQNKYTYLNILISSNYPPKTSSNTSDISRKLTKFTKNLLPTAIVHNFTDGCVKKYESIGPWRALMRNLKPMGTTCLSGLSWSMFYTALSVIVTCHYNGYREYW